MMLLANTQNPNLGPSLSLMSPQDSVLALRRAFYKGASMALSEEERKKRRKEVNKRYNDSEKGRASVAKYRTSETGKAARRRSCKKYSESEKGKANQKQYGIENKLKLQKQSAKYYQENKEQARENARKWRAANLERYRELKRVSRRKILKDPAHRERLLAREAVRNATRYGRLTREPCEVCGATPAQGHHDSYKETERLNVRWLCRKHHQEHHNNLKEGKK